METKSIKIRDKLMVDHSLEDDEDTYEDVRNELRTTGHNLTSVLINPRETVFDSFMDEFANEQSFDVDLVTATSSLSALANFTFGNPFGTYTPTTSTTYSDSSVSTHGKVNTTTLTSASLPLFLPNLEDSTDLQRLRARLRKVLKQFDDVFLSHNVPDTVSVLTSLTPNKQGSQVTDEVKACFNQVPAVYFKPDFTLQDADIFQLPPDTTTTQKSAVISASSKGNTIATSSSIPMHSTSMTTPMKLPPSHDRLSMYLDTVEVALLKQIWTRSPDFFKSLDDISALSVRVEETCRIIHHIKSNLRHVDAEVALTAMRIPQLHIRHNNERKLQGILISIQRVRESFTIIQSLVKVDDYVGALQLTHENLHVIDTELRGIRSISVLKKNLLMTQSEVGEKLVRMFIEQALEWQESSISGSTAEEMKSASTAVLSDSDPLDYTLTALLTASLLDRALVEYKNKLCDNVRLIVRTCVTEYMTSFDPLTWAQDLGDKLFEECPAGAEDAPFAQRVRAMSNENFLSALTICVENLILSLQRTASVNNAITHRYQQYEVSAVSSSSSSSSSSKSINPSSNTYAITSVSLELSHQCVQAACDLAQRSISQLLKIRREATIRLSLDKMKFLSEMMLNFLQSMDSIYNQEIPSKSVTNGNGSSSNSSGNSSNNNVKSIYSLNESHIQLLSYDEKKDSVSSPTSVSDTTTTTTTTTMRNGHTDNTTAVRKYVATELCKTLRTQTRSYLDHLHDSFKQKLISTLDTDRWVQADISTERQHNIDKLVTGRLLISTKNGMSSVSMSSASTAPLITPRLDNKSEKKKDSRPVIVHGTQYNVVWSCLLLCEFVITLLDISSTLVCIDTEAISKEAIPKIVELLKLFDSRTRLLVLGAGAIQSAARLKSISAKHLAYTAQSLGFIKSLIPHMRAALLGVLQPSQHMLMSELERVANDYLDHHSMIVTKLVTIAGDTIDASVFKLRTVDWDKHHGNCDYFDDVIRNISALHRVLHDCIPTELLQDIFSRIFALLCRKIPGHFEELNIMPTTPLGRQKIIDEVKQVCNTLNKLKHIDPGSNLLVMTETFQKRYST